MHQTPEIQALFKASDKHVLRLWVKSAHRFRNPLTM